MVFSDEKVVFRILKVTFSDEKVTFRNEKVTFSDEKVTFSGEKVTFRNEKVTFSDEKVVFCNLQNRLQSRCPKGFQQPCNLYCKKIYTLIYLA